MIDLDALSAENGAMIRTVEVFDPHVVRHTEFVLGEAAFNCIFIEIYGAQQRIALYNLVQDVDVQR